MTDRAVKSFLAQTYENKRLLILDTGENPAVPDIKALKPALVSYGHFPEHRGKFTIGHLRNVANQRACGFHDPDVIAHFDSDDVSAPTRLAEQVAHLQASGADAVGYSDMLFWDTTGCGPDGWVPTAIHKPRAWLFNNHKPSYALGTSLLYWRKTWERKPFPEHTNPGCDDRLWVEGLKVASVSSLREPAQPSALHPLLVAEPQMVAEIHGGNTCASITEPSTDWTRVPAWDEKLRSIMAL